MQYTQVKEQMEYPIEKDPPSLGDLQHIQKTELAAQSPMGV